MTSWLTETVQIAASHYEAGRLQQAEQLCLHVLQIDPEQAAAMLLLGVIAATSGQHALACNYFRRVAQLRPSDAVAHNNLGGALFHLGHLREAAAAYEQAIHLQPSYAEARYNLRITLMEQGKALAAQGQWEQAASFFRQAVPLQPDAEDAHNALGVALLHQQNLKEAIACLEQAVRCDPNSAWAWSNLGLAYHGAGRLQEAVASSQEALRRQPDLVAAFCNMGLAYLSLEKIEEAVAANQEAICLQPDCAQAHYNLGLALKRSNRLAEAAQAFQQAIHFGIVAEAYNDLGLTRRMQGRYEEALAGFDEALRRRPDFVDAHLCKASTLLLIGDFIGGWPEYEWRTRWSGFGAPYYAASPQPTWDGSPLNGRTILLRAEQGFGDTIQFVRYAGLVQQRGGRVLVEVQPRLRSLVATCPSIEQVVCRCDPLPPFDVQALLLSLPSIFGTTLETIPSAVPYLAADPTLVEHWRHELGTVPGFKVGIVWQGQPATIMDWLRSVPLQQFAPLAGIEGVQLISLQVGAGCEQLSKIPFAVTDLGSRFNSDSFADVAAAIKNLDLLITVDTAVAHLAGALGAPVWVAIGFSPDWRWLLGRGDSPWYPTIRLFRQLEPGQWGPVFQRMAAELRNLIANRPVPDPRCNP
jgi:tetratricopeptide (TPR) repeat protein